LLGRRPRLGSTREAKRGAGESGGPRAGQAKARLAGRIPNEADFPFLFLFKFFKTNF
jgi:hypothetical protein